MNNEYYNEIAGIFRRQLIIFAEMKAARMGVVNIHNQVDTTILLAKRLADYFEVVDNNFNKEQFKENLKIKEVKQK